MRVILTTHKFWDDPPSEGKSKDTFQSSLSWSLKKAGFLPDFGAKKCIRFLPENFCKIAGFLMGGSTLTWPMAKL